MIIDLGDKTSSVRLADLGHGSAFRFRGDVFIKTDEQATDGHTKIVNLKSGVICYYSPDIEVIRVEAKVVLA